MIKIPHIEKYCILTLNFFGLSMARVTHLSNIAIYDGKKHVKVMAYIK